MLPPETKMTSWPRLSLRAMSRSMVLLLKLGSVLMSIAQATTRGQAAVCSLGCNLNPGGCLRAVLQYWNMLI